MPADLERLRAALADRYDIQRELGRGGMATVYLAEDLKHGRRVAIKVLHPELAATLGTERFLREIQIAAGLNHPHIVPLHDSGEADSFPYYVMPYLEGESLRDRLDREGPLPVADALRVAREVASALSHAHEQRVLHRDIKPANILLSAGEAVVADFGIARAVGVAGGEQLTATGMSIGTPAYMSPEQATGEEEVDARSDLYALGCVLHEMLAGSPPFTGPNSQAVMARKVTEPAPGVRGERPEVSEELEAVVLKALARAPGDRYASAAEFEQALKAGLPRAEWVRAGRSSRARKRSVAVAATALLVLAAWSAYTTFLTRPAFERLVILPPEPTPDSVQNVFLAGMHKELNDAAGRISGLVAVARPSALAFLGSGETISEFARRVNADAAVEFAGGSAGDSVWLTARLYDADERALWDSTFHGTYRGQLALYSRAARAIAWHVGVLPTEEEETRLETVQEVDPEAYEAYLWGLHFLELRTSPGAEKAIEWFHRAIERDSRFARAYAGLADAHNFLGRFYQRPFAETYSEARRYAEQALALDGTLAEAHAALAVVKLRLQWDWEGAEYSFRRAIDLNADYAYGHFHYGFILHLLGRYDEAVLEARRAVRLDPLDRHFRANLGAFLVYSGAVEAGIEELNDVISLYPDWPWAPLYSAYAHAHLDQWDDAAAQWDSTLVRFEAEGQEPNPAVLALTGQAYAKAGRRDEASAILDDLLGRRAAGVAGDYIPSDFIAHVYAGLGQLDEAMAWLNRAYEEHEQGLILLKTWAYRDLYPDPRYRELLRKVFGAHAD